MQHTQYKNPVWQGQRAHKIVAPSICHCWKSCHTIFDRWTKLVMEIPNSPCKLHSPPICHQSCYCGRSVRLIAAQKMSQLPLQASKSERVSRGLQLLVAQEVHQHLQMKKALHLPLCPLLQSLMEDPWYPPPLSFSYVSLECKVWNQTCTDMEAGLTVAVRQIGRAAHGLRWLPMLLSPGQVDPTNGHPNHPAHPELLDE